MEWMQMKNKVFSAITKHKYALAVAALGLVLMLLPLGSQKEPAQETAPPTTAPEDTSQQDLQQLLSCIDGAGKVEVLLTYASGSLTVYQEDQDLPSGETGTARYDTVIIRDSGGGESGLVRQVIPGKYLGAVIVCQGANKPAVKLAIVEAVSKATGLGADQISVLKMK